MREPERQNHYPDFTLMRSEEDRSKVAIDVKTTYRESGTDTFSYTLGGYTSYIRPQTEAKNILYPFSHYREHWIIGFVYRRAKGGSVTRIHSLDELGDIQPPFDDVEVFMQRKWRIAGDRAGSGNTTNIGSIKGTIDDFVRGKGVFRSEEEFLGYWRGYGRTGDERKRTYSNISEYRKRMQ